ncbi:hypothetical protein [Kordiimonas gwangyangensis]|uniref:hypothetical protein n=1 Tax=Kordiimonas gwangyangensis TaxID=288022 RepID=UPI000AF2AB83|nr:hypothetical protein [Kordiimonas gwangyangensis]
MHTLGTKGCEVAFNRIAVDAVTLTACDAADIASRLSPRLNCHCAQLESIQSSCRRR